MAVYLSSGSILLTAANNFSEASSTEIMGNSHIQTCKYYVGSKYKCQEEAA
jgi:hypothetical protein